MFLWRRCSRRRAPIAREFIFPYQTDDRSMTPRSRWTSHLGQGHAWGATLWRPLIRVDANLPSRTPTLKTTHCEAVMFEEEPRPRPTFRTSGSVGASAGSAGVVNESEDASIEILDGSTGLMPRTSIGPCRPSSALCWTRTGWRRWRPRAASDSSASARSRSTSRGPTRACARRSSSVSTARLCCPRRRSPPSKDWRCGQGPRRGGRSAHPPQRIPARGRGTAVAAGRDVEQDDAAVVELMEALRDTSAVEEAISEDPGAAVKR